MRFYKNGIKPFQGDKETLEKVFNIKLTEITEEEFKDLVKTTNMPSPEQEISRQVAEAKEFLNNTDYINNKYNDEVTVLGTSSKADFVAEHKELYLERAEKRAFIKENEIKI